MSKNEATIESACLFISNVKSWPTRVHGLPTCKKVDRGRHLSWRFTPLDESVLYLHDGCCSTGGATTQTGLRNRLCLNAERERTQLDPWESASQDCRTWATASLRPSFLSGLCPASLKNLCVLDASLILTMPWVLWLLCWPSGALWCCSC